MKKLAKNGKILHIVWDSVENIRTRMDGECMDMLYDVILLSFNADEIMIIDLCMTLCNMDANQAYKAVDSMPYTLATAVDMKQAKKIKKAFEYEGAYIDVIVSNNKSYNKEVQCNNSSGYNQIEEYNSSDEYNNQMQPFSQGMDIGDNLQYSEQQYINPYDADSYSENEKSMEDFREQDLDEQENEEEGINLEKVFETHTEILDEYEDYQFFCSDGVISKETGKNLLFNATAEVYAFGSMPGDFNISADVSTAWDIQENDEITFYANAKFCGITPSFFEEKYISRYYSWENHFKQKINYFIFCFRCIG